MARLRIYEPKEIKPNPKNFNKLRIRRTLKDQYLGK